MTDLYFYLTTNPEPWSIGPVSVSRAKGGKLFGRVGQNSELAAYQAAVREEVASNNFAIFPKGTPLSIYFWFWRRLDVYTGPSGRKITRNRSDATNMQKALEDALQGVLYHNDRDNVVVGSKIVEQNTGCSPLTIVHITEPLFEEFPPEVENQYELAKRTSDEHGPGNDYSSSGEEYF